MKLELELMREGSENNHYQGVFLAPWTAKARAHFYDQYLVVYWLFN